MTLFEIKEKDLADAIFPGIDIKKIKIGNYDINYAKVGSGPPLVLVHGANIGWGQWHLNILALAEHFTVYAIDLPGSGGSTKINYNTLNLEKDFVDVVRLMVRSLNINEYHFIGHSIGAWVGLKLAMGGKINKMILVNPLGLSNYMPFKYRPISIPFVANLISRTVMRPNKKNMKKFLQSVLWGSYSLSDVFVDYFYEGVNKDKISHPLSLISRLSGFFKMKDELVLVKDLDKVKSPTLVIVGDRDPLISQDSVRKNISMLSNAHLEVFTDTGHVALLEKSDQFNKVAINFLID